jgi:hypothetical protein
VTYAGIKQRWLIVESAESKHCDIQKLESKIAYGLTCKLNGRYSNHLRQ